MRFWSLQLLEVSILLFVLGSVTAEQCGRQDKGALCPNGLCCSQAGYCGDTDPYCGTGCQSQCSGPTPTPDPPATGQCGKQGKGALCPNNMCCSENGYCGTTIAYCGDGCQSQCPAPTPPPPPPSPTPPAPPSPLEPLIDSDTFDKLLPYRNDPRCESKGFYTYYAFITAANSFSKFGTTGDLETRKREIAAFLGQTSHEITGGWADADDGPYAWGYCKINEENVQSDYCSPSTVWPCVDGKNYHGRGPIQLSWNYNYGQCGDALEYDLLSDPDAVANDAVLSFKTALWFWMTAQEPKPSCHDVITGLYHPNQADTDSGRVSGYGLITNIINGGVECGNGPDSRQVDRIGFYKRYCDEFGLSYGDNLDCNDQRPFALFGFKSDV